MKENGEGAEDQAKYVRLKNHEDGSDFADTLHKDSSIPTHCLRDGCHGSIINHKDQVQRQDRLKSRDAVLAEAEDFIKQFYEHNKLVNTEQHVQRWNEVKQSIQRTSTYDLEKEELIFGAKTAWRNASRCIGRIQWNNLEVLDARLCSTAEDMFEALCQHLEVATNGGNIRSTITVFKHRVDTPEKDFRIWNHQLVRYAGYLQPDGTVVGDPGEVDFTKVCETLGWKGAGGQFDVLPLILQVHGEDPKLFELPKHLVMEVPLKHPKYKWFQDLGLRWHAVPAISSMMFDIGGLQFPAAPFNGWYMQSEVARNFCDTNRYNLLPVVANKLGLDTQSNYSLWRDEAFLEFNKAILHSYKESGVTIIDHHSASDSFMSHMANEQRARRGCPADWVWVVPPIGGSLCKVFHQEMLNYHLRPSYEYLNDAWHTHVWANQELERKFKQTGSRKLHSFKSCALVVKFCTSLTFNLTIHRPNTLILFATETGKSERYAKQAHNVFQHSFKSRVLCMESYEASSLQDEDLVLVVTSTFGNGDPPTNGVKFYGDIRDLVENKTRLLNTNYSIFALGSSAYPNFCRFGKNLDKILQKLNANRIVNLATGDELRGEAENFRVWLANVFMMACKHFNIHRRASVISDVMQQDADADLWSPDKVTLRQVESATEELVGLSSLHRNRLMKTRLISRENLHKGPNPTSSTLFLRLKVDDDVTYQPGDHVGLFPQNDPEMVKNILARIDSNFNVDHPVVIAAPSLNVSSEFGTDGVNNNNIKNSKIAKKDGVGDENGFPACTMRTALRCYFDITTPPSAEFLKCLALLASSSAEQTKLKILAKGEKEYVKWKLLKHPSLVDVLQEFRSVTLHPSLLMTQLPLLQPRLYSISSVLGLCPGEVHLTVSVVDYYVLNSPRKKRAGVASSWLSTITPDTRVPIYVKPALDFRLPADLSVPLIFLATGSGIAPIRSFWQELARHLTDKTEKLMLQIINETYDTTLYYGCRTEDRYLYKDEIENAKMMGALKNVRVAFSREAGQEKKYVQHLLEEDGESIAEKIVSKKGHIYVCGAVQLAEDVHNTVVKILREHQGYSVEKAETFIEVMKKTRRYHEDVFGILESKRNFVDESPKQNGGGGRTLNRRSSTCTLL